MNLQTDFENIFFVGAGGIGMSALALFFLNKGKKVAGYDAVKSEITTALQNKGAFIFFEDNPALIPDEFKEKNKTIVVFTPAIPFENKVLSFFADNGFEILKRAEALEKITENKKTIAIAGTHGKSTITAMTAHILKQAGMLDSAFVGAILKNYGSNYIEGDNPDGYLVVEADEYDKSFLRLKPYLSLVSYIDADHLDIYENAENVKKAFREFLNNTIPEGIKILNANVKLNIEKYFTYSIEEGSDFYATNIDVFKQKQFFDLNTFRGVIEEIEILLPGKANLENAIAASAVSLLLGVSPSVVKDALANFRGIRRRFDKVYDEGNKIIISDYAHHPTELKALAEAVNSFYKGKKILAVFQPHLYSRTRDFADEFAKTLDRFPRVILTDIYPAREKPLPGVSHKLIIEKAEQKITYIPYENLTDYLAKSDFEVLLMIGAGNIDNLVKPLIEKIKR